MSSPRRRMETDVIRLLQSDYEIELVNDCNMREFYVRFTGPDETPFAGGVWKVHVELPEEYPYKSPSIGFRNRIFHPNIDEVSGSVCLDVINQAWTPLYQLENIFTLFLPHLLRYPNASDPLNGEAAALYMSHPELYDQRVKDYVRRYASGDSASRSADQKEEEESEEEEMSDLSDVDFSDEDAAAQMEL